MRPAWIRIREPGCLLDIQYRQGPRKTSWRVRYTPEKGPLRGSRRVVILQKERGIIRNWEEALKLAFAQKTKDEEGLSVVEKKQQEKKTHSALRRAEEIIESLIESKHRKAGGTYQDIRYYCRTYIIPYFNSHCPYVSEFTQDHWDGTGDLPLGQKPRCFLSWFEEMFPGYCPFNVKKYFGMVHKRFMAEGLLKKPVVLSLGKRRISPGKRLTQEEAGRLLSACDSLKTPSKEHLKLAILMGLHLGMRRGEIIKLKWDRIDLKRGEIALRAEDTKTRHAREFAISPNILFILRRKHQDSKSPFVFPNRDNPQRPMYTFKTAWTGVRERAKVKCRFHDLRHTFLSEALLTHQMDPLKVAVFAGVSLHVIETVYLHPRAEDTRCVMEAVSTQYKGLQNVV